MTSEVVDRKMEYGAVWTYLNSDDESETSVLRASKPGPPKLVRIEPLLGWFGASTLSSCRLSFSSDAGSV